MGICESPLSVVTEFLEGGSLLEFIRKNKEMDLNLKYKIILGIARGMLHLHLENIIHRDLAARNVLLTASQQPKISDFVIKQFFFDSIITYEFSILNSNIFRECQESTLNKKMQTKHNQTQDQSDGWHLNALN